MKILSMLIATALALACSSIVLGCGSAPPELRSGIESARDIVTAAEPCFVSEHDALLADCEKRPVEDRQACAEDVKASFAPIAAALDKFHAAWCVLAPTSEGCSK